MKKLLPILGLSAVMALSLAQEGGKENPGSLVSNSQNMFVDRVARRVGDIVSIVVDESSVASFKASTSAVKGDQNGITSQFFNGLLDRLLRPITTGANSNVSGSGNTSQQSSMQARIAVIVREVLPNGNLVVEGKRSLVTNRETQTLILSGIIRPFDIKPDNTVPSTAVADAMIRMEGQGLIADRQRRGVLTQIMDWLF